MDKTNLMLFVSLFILITLTSFSNAILVDSEDFENYSFFYADELDVIGSVLIINESGGKWNCSITNSYLTNCLDINGAPTNGEGGIAIYNDGSGNKYLNLKSNNAIGANSFTANLIWDMNNITYANSNTIVMRLKFFNYVDVLGQYLYNTAYAQLGAPAVAKTAITSNTIGMTAGHTIFNNTIEGMYSFNMIRPYFFIPYWRPLTATGCYIMDGNWHEITTIWNNNTQVASLYDNGILCTQTSAPLPISVMDVMHFRVRGDYEVGIDDIKVYNNIVYPNPYGDDIVLDINYCPIQGCLFYDDFDYTDSNQSLINNGWSFPVGFPIVDNGSVYFNSGIVTESRAMYNTLPEYNYAQVSSVVKFKFNGTMPTPESMTDQFMIFGLSAECADSEYVAINRLYFARADEFTLSENSTVVNAYMSYGGKPRLLGSMTYDNNEYFYMYTVYDNVNRLIHISFIRADDLPSFEPEDYMFTIPYMTNCDPQNFALWRFDSENTAVDKFIGVDKIYWFGLSAVISDIKGNTTYQWINATPYNESTNTGDWGETIQDTIESFGFRTEQSKLLLYGVIFIALIITCFKLPSNHGAQLYAMLGVSIIWSLISWKIGLITTALFTVLIFIMAVLGAYVIREMLKGNAPAQ